MDSNTKFDHGSDGMRSFEELVQSRKDWIEHQLKTWCQKALRDELLKADAEWLDIAGKVLPEKTLWPWAWSRFPDLVHESLGIDETSQVRVNLKDGRNLIGYPDSRKSIRGQLVLWGMDAAGRMDTPEELGPFSIDQIESVHRFDSPG